MEKSKLPLITKSRLISDLKKLGVAFGDTIMLHASVKAIGWIVGGRCCYPSIVRSIRQGRNIDDACKLGRFTLGRTLQVC
ncbi:MAG: hypothetical protein QHH17_03240 [Candidatus Bathyarchaeota archaeon]|nr:hypothetical protein [Candidatus Bathyarchaeota archaeon]